MEFSKRYNPFETENKWYDFWVKKGYFQPDIFSKDKSYSIVIPPPNVTGILHMGHALNNTVQDILIRFNRMKGVNSLWVPGTDHAGIATQNVVERKLKNEGKSRKDLGRQEFIGKVWQWKEKHGSTIINQLKKLGCSCDWSRLRFTMDEGLSEAVKEVFIRLYNEGLIYRGNYIINWCPRCHTALSDEESEHKQTQGNLYYIKYPVLDKNFCKSKKNDYIVVATTRPETMLGDVAVAVNPSDKRFKNLKNKTVILPILKRELKVIEDNLVDPEFGTGIVKVTPSHDPNDFEMGRKHALEFICILNSDGTLNKNAREYEGLDRFECRKKIVEDLKALNLIEKIEKHTHQVGHCYRCDTVIEPMVSKQWFVKMKPLAEPAIKAVKNKEVNFHPARWKKVYLNWMENIRDWCISRQIWWGHRLPVYYCIDCHESDTTNTEKNFEEKGVIVSKEKPAKCPFCGSSRIIQDEDVLDTWFSSWLWPFSTMGWPENTKELEKFYPTNTLVTAQEIIFFWVARMIMSGFKFMNQAPFKDVYIHGTVRDDTGTKMSKSLGNVIDPIEIINQFGADALRFSMISITALGQDVFLSPEKFHLGRNFANKIWNASRFVLSFHDDYFKKSTLSLSFKKEEIKNLNLWIKLNFNNCVKNTTKSLESFNFNKSADEIYSFFWHTFCDWYLEMCKIILISDKVDKEDKCLTYKTMLDILSDSLKLIHPFMPFITEEIYQRIKNCAGSSKGIEKDSIMISKWPCYDKSLIKDRHLIKDFDLIINVISSIRNIKSELGIPLSAKTKLSVKYSDECSNNILKTYSYFIEETANISEIVSGVSIKKPKHSATAVIGSLQIFVSLEGLIDIEAEKERIKKNISDLEMILEKAALKVNNKQFLEKAPLDIVNKTKENYARLKEKKEKLVITLKDISS